jgi:hypothetical protein
MTTKKFKGFIVTDELPKAGDIMVCINRKYINYGETCEATHLQVKHKTIDTKNWKVVVNLEERKEAIVDDVIESLKQDIANGDLTVLDELLKMIPEKSLIHSLNEETWKQYNKIKKQ